MMCLKLNLATYYDLLGEIAKYLLHHSIFRSSWFEILYTTLCLLCHAIVLSKLFLRTRSQYFGAPIKPQAWGRKTIPLPDLCFKFETSAMKGNVVDLNMRAIEKISVLSAPLAASFRSSKPSIRSRLRLQLFGMDYHAFVVLKTNDGLWWSLEKMPDGIYVSRGNIPESVIFCFGDEVRPEPVCVLAVDYSDSSLQDIFHRVNHILKTKSEYDVMKNNCQHFAKELFCKFAKHKTWEPITISDVTSPVSLFSYDRVPLFLLMGAIALIGELYLLQAHHSIGISIIILLFFVITFKSCFSNNDAADLILFNGLCILFLLMEIDGLSLESFILKRKRYYCSESKTSNSVLYKSLISLCYGIIYMASSIKGISMAISLPFYFVGHVLAYDHLLKINDAIHGLFLMKSVAFFSSVFSFLYFIFSC